MLAYKIDEYCFFTKAEDSFYQLVAIIKEKETNHMSLSDMETLLHEKLQDIGRDLIQAKMNMVGYLDSEAVVKGSDGVARSRKRLKGRKIETRFGEVDYERWGYGAPGVDSLFPADGHLNLPPEKYTHAVRRLVSEDVTRSSYDEALEVLAERTAAKVPKRQGLELSRRAAEDFVTFYDEGATLRPDLVVASEDSGSLLILTTDGKGGGHAARRAAGGDQEGRRKEEKQSRETPISRREGKLQADVAGGVRVYHLPVYPDGGRYSG